MRILGKTDVGKIRKVNQDDYAYGEFPGGSVWAVVCDGMGGANGGNIASTEAVKKISEKLISGFDTIRESGVKQLLVGALDAANAEVYGKSAADPALSGMGTTVVACIADRDTVYIAHAGDSRAYLVGPSGVVQLTRDHSIVQELLESGKLTPDEAKDYPQKHIITRALGVEETLDIDYCEATFAEHSKVLLCSDGLSNHVEPEAFEQTINDPQVGDPAAKLVDIANDNGGSDNVTVVIIMK
jgi:serine/threonine protein phosphatase PrpC